MATAAVVAIAGPASAQAAGPTAIGVDEAGTSYVGWASGAVKRYGPAGQDLGQWQVQVSDTAGRLGPVMAIDVADAGATGHGGNVWVLDANRRVQEFTRTGTFIRGFRVDACDGSNSPDPGLEGGLDVTPDAIYVAHPCANRIFRYALGALPATGTSAASPAATAETNETYAPHGISAQTGGGASPAQTRTLYVTHALSSVVRQYDLVSLALLGDAPGGHSGRYDDVFIDVGGSLFVSETNNDQGYDDRIFRYDADGNGNDDLNFGGPGTAMGQLSDARAFDVSPQTGEIYVADTGNERVQRFVPSGSPVWAAAAGDPGPYTPPATQDPPGDGTSPGGGDGGTLPGGGGSTGAGGTTGVVIEGGARYTNSAFVTLTVREPVGTTAVEIANASAFTEKDTRAVRSSLDYDWTLDGSGSDLNPRTVYVRFPGSGSDRVYSDEITLDRRAPLVGAATLSRKSRKRGHRRRSVLRVAGEDEVSGVDQLQFSATADGEYRSWNYEGSVTVRHASRFRFVRLTDFAGNVSKPVAVQRDH